MFDQVQAESHDLFPAQARVQSVLEYGRDVAADGQKPTQSPGVDQADKGQKLERADEHAGRGKVALFARLFQAPLRGLLCFLILLRHISTAR